MLSRDRLKKFKKIYKNRFGKELSDQTALESATKLLRLVELVYKPMTEAEFKLVEKRRKDLSREE